MTGDFRRNAVFLSFGLLPTKKRQMADKRGAKRGCRMCVCAFDGLWSVCADNKKGR